MVSSFPMKSNFIWQGLHSRYCGLQWTFISWSLSFGHDMIYFTNSWNVMRPDLWIDLDLIASIVLLIVSVRTFLLLLRNFALKEDIKREIGFLTNIKVLKGLCWTELVIFTSWKSHRDRKSRKNKPESRPRFFVWPLITSIRYFIVVDAALWTRQIPTGRWLSTKNVTLKNWSGGSFLQARSTVLCRSNCSCRTGEVYISSVGYLSIKECDLLWWYK